PDLSESLGAPNACNGCHADKSARWAADAVVKWYGPTRKHGPAFAEAIAAGRGSRADAEAQLVRTADDHSIPSIARATAVAQLADSLSAASLPSLERATRDPDPMVRRAAAESLIVVDPRDRVALGAPLLRDPVRSVRIEALGALLDAPASAFSKQQVEV